MKISNEIGIYKKCKGCVNKENCTPLKFEFNYHSCEIDCYWKDKEYYDYDCTIKLLEVYYKNKVTNWHRDDGPAYIEYDKNGKIMIEEWCQNDKIHRIGGPAYIEYDKNG